MSNQLSIVLWVVLLAAFVGFIYTQPKAEQVSITEPVELTYFPIRGRAEAIRLLLEVRGISYVDHQLSSEEWQQEKAMFSPSKYKFGQLPHLQDGDNSISQSIAILAHLDRVSTGKLVRSTKEQLQLDQFALGLEDLRKPYGALAYGDKSGRKEYIATTLPKGLAYFEHALMDNGGFYGGGHHLVGEELTYVDIMLFDNLVTNMHPALAPNCLEEFPMLKAFHARMMELPAIKAYMASDRRPTQQNGNSSWVK